jgi:hypothetical protein
MPEATRVKLRAHDIEDMDVIASLLQDALIPLSEIAYQRAERRLVMVVNRFMWERGDAQPEAQEVGAQAVPAETEPAEAERAAGDAGPEAAPGDARFEDSGPRQMFHRISSGLTFDKVQNVSARNIDLRDKKQILNLLTIASEPRSVTLHFSDGGQLRIAVAEIRCHMEDLGEPWPTWMQPDHGLDAAPEAR